MKIDLMNRARNCEIVLNAFSMEVGKLFAVRLTGFTFHAADNSWSVVPLILCHTFYREFIVCVCVCLCGPDA